MSSRLLLTWCAILWLSSLNAQSPIVYTLDLGNIHHHELGVEVVFPSLSPQPLVVRMPTASPGRYAIHNFAKNVYAISAYDSVGNPLPISRTGVSEWTIPHDGHVVFKYTIFANRADGTYAKVDNRKLHLNMPATFVHGIGLEQRPIELHVPDEQQPHWGIATQLVRLDERRLYAPNYYYFYDSPTFMGDIRFRRWTVDSETRVDTIEMAFLTPDPDSLLDAYAQWTKDIVAEQQRVYGELPAFDYGRYTFLCAYNAYVNGDGMEHRNSTVCSASVPLDGYQSRLIGTVSHEFFHSWNVERIRPASLEPFNFDEANMSGELWFAEGFTSYYDDLSLVRAGVITEEEYASGITRMLNYVLLRPGTNYRSPIGMSQCAPFVDAATSIDGDNFDNTFVSYYSYGAVLGLVLDLQLRKDFDTNLDALMRLVWKKHGQTEVPYHIPDLEESLATLTADEGFAKTWFQQYIYGRELPDVLGLLEEFGIDYEVRNTEDVGFYQLELQEEEDALFINGTMFVNNPLYRAGVESGDQIVAINGEKVNTLKDWERVMGKLQKKQTYSVEFMQNGVKATGWFVADNDPAFNVFLQTDAKGKVRKRRASWLKP